MKTAGATLVGNLLALFANANAQALKPQTNTFNSDFKLTDDQISTLDLTEVQANNLNIAIQFEQSNWATGSVFNDSFYTSLPSKARSAPAGTLLEVEEFTDTSKYTIAPTLALSRIIYQSKTLNGTLVPASAFILWPYLNRNGASKAPLVSWGHGTSGIFAECGPSHIRNLWYQFSAPYELALSGFAVVASDYAGLGVPFYQDGKPITHQYVASPAAGNDILYAAQAAYAAFPSQLTREFVAMGHSQGGGAAWAAAQQQVKANVPGYLGAIAISPVTSAIDQAKASGSSLGLIQIAKAIPSVFPKVKISDMLTPKGVAVFNLLEEVQACNSGITTLIGDLFTVDPTLALTKDAFIESAAAENFAKLTVAGGKDFRGPMLVIQGTADSVVSPDLTSEYVKRTCKSYASNGLHYLTVKGVDHVPVLYATQQRWLSWLDDRFERVHRKHRRSEGQYGNPPAKCTFETIGAKTPRPLDQYAGDLNYFLEYALDAYSVA
ncbi:hypothetical protein G7046_g842 [Stylonectria norvegica]|nr:hypothetical protein G7046_g842 [Stylonectria norvegica]